MKQWRKIAKIVCLILIGDIYFIRHMLNSYCHLKKMFCQGMNASKNGLLTNTIVFKILIKKIIENLLKITKYLKISQSKNILVMFYFSDVDSSDVFVPLSKYEISFNGWQTKK